MTTTDHSGLLWPDALDRAAVTDWIARTLGRPVDRLTLIDTKLWGCTAVATAAGATVVLKAAIPAVFPTAHLVDAFVHPLAPTRVPRPLGWCEAGSQHWSLFEHVAGADATDGGATAILEIARVAGELQRAASQHHLPPGLPVTRPREVVDMLVDDVDDIDPELLDRLAARRPRLRSWAAELEDAVPLSIDHPDLRLGNAIAAPHGIVLIDWEEATVGCPLISLERLLDDARDLGVERATADAHAAALLPDLGLPDRRRLLAIASVLAPIQRAAEARAFAAALGWEYRHTRLVEVYLRRSLERSC